MTEQKNSQRVSVRLDAKLKKQAQKILAKRGLTISEELRAHLERVIKREAGAAVCRHTTDEEVVGQVALPGDSKLQLTRTVGRIDC